MTDSQQANVPLFRQHALDAMDGVDKLKQDLQVVENRPFVMIGLAVMALATIVAWLFNGNIDRQVTGQGVLLPLGHLRQLESIYQESSLEHASAVKRLEVLLSKMKMLYEKHLITVDELERARQDYMRTKTANINSANAGLLDPAKLFSPDSVAHQSELVALIFVNHRDGKKIKPGMSVCLLPSFLSEYEYGYIKGIVSKISEYPISKELAVAYLGNMSLVEEYFSAGAPYAVLVSLEQNHSLPGGVNWTSKQGAPYELSAGATVSANMVYRHYHPYELLSRVSL